jgi:hypothetical protein
MTVYMLRNNERGLYYRRGPQYGQRWVKQEKASIWTSKVGPAAAKSRQNKPKLEIVPFELVEKQ